MKNIADQIQAIQERAKNKKKEKPLEASDSIPKTKNGQIAAPNVLFRSALFPALSNKTERKQFKKENLFSVGGLNVTFTGEQFDQSDLDVYLEILNIANSYHIGEKIEFSAYSMLKALGKSTGGDQHKWLHNVLFRLVEGTVELKDHQHSYTGSLVNSFLKDEITKHYKVWLNPAYAVLFSNGLWSGINKEQRQAIGKNPTAKSLHAYYSTHTNPAAHKIETLAKIAGLENKNKYMIPNTIIRAHEILCSEKVSFLESYEINENKIKANIKNK